MNSMSVNQNVEGVRKSPVTAAADPIQSLVQQLTSMANTQHQQSQVPQKSTSASLHHRPQQQQPSSIAPQKPPPQQQQPEPPASWGGMQQQQQPGVGGMSQQQQQELQGMPWMPHMNNPLWDYRDHLIKIQQHKVVSRLLSQPFRALF